MARSIFGGAGKFRGRHGQRDSMRQRSYDAERSTAMWGVMQWGKRATVEQCQAFVDKALARATVRKQYGRRSVRVTDSGGKGGACASHSTIYVSTYYRNHIVLLHELAHCLTPRDVGHGREWARCYVQLVATMMGAEAGKALRDAFRQYGVKTKRVTAAQRERGRQLAAMAKERGDGGAGLARYREQQRADTAALLAAGWVYVAGRHGGWQHEATKQFRTRAGALAIVRGTAAAPEPDVVHVSTWDDALGQYVESVELPERDETRLDYLAAVYTTTAANDYTSGPYVPE